MIIIDIKNLQMMEEVTEIMVCYNIYDVIGYILYIVSKFIFTMYFSITINNLLHILLELILILPLYNPLY